MTSKPKSPAPLPPSDNGNVGSNRPRRKPRKLNKQPEGTSPAPVQNAGKPVAPKNTVSKTAPSNTPTTLVVSSAELDALKNRVRGLEAKVEELCRAGRSPRRRGKGKRKASVQTEAEEREGPQKGEDDEEKVEEELDRLEGELEVAKQDLARHTKKASVFQETSQKRGYDNSDGGVRLPDVENEDEYIEEIPRGGQEEVVSTGDKLVTLTGSYRIPLPNSVRLEDVKSIQDGIASAQNIAKSFLEQKREGKTSQAPRTGPSPSTTEGASASGDGTGRTEGQSWSEWFGGYSMAISRAVKSIEAEAAVESRKSTSRGTKLPARGKSDARSRARGLSRDQVETLMS